MYIILIIILIIIIIKIYPDFNFYLLMMYTRHKSNTCSFGHYPHYLTLLALERQSHALPVTEN